MATVTQSTSTATGSETGSGWNYTLHVVSSYMITTTTNDGAGTTTSLIQTGSVDDLYVATFDAASGATTWTFSAQHGDDFDREADYAVNKTDAESGSNVTITGYDDSEGSQGYSVQASGATFADGW